jgi:hypothetical protein
LTLSGFARRVPKKLIEEILTLQVLDVIQTHPEKDGRSGMDVVNDPEEVDQRD